MCIQICSNLIKIVYMFTKTVLCVHFEIIWTSIVCLLQNFDVKHFKLFCVKLIVLRINRNYIYTLLLKLNENTLVILVF
jgi:hypothetical protein